ncbi:SPOR domain-containing protein [Leptolyngbya sp. BL0902]|nr:SPOR domain-containing protein [Leptolyngbya sp. BL0902]
MVNLDDEILRYRHSRTGQGPRPDTQRKLAFRPKGRPAPSLMPLQASGSKPSQGQPTRRLTDPPVPQKRRTASATPSLPAYAPGAIPGVPPTAATDLGSTLAPYAPAPDAYLESTAALLGSAPAAAPIYRPEEPYYPEPYFPQDEADYEPSLAQRLSTPLGVGALLLLLVGSAGLGYLATSPAALDHLRDRVGLGHSSSPAPDAEDGAPPALGEVPTGLQGIGPDLSGQTFDALDLDRVSRLPVEPSRSGASLEPADRALNSAPGADSAPAPTEASPTEAGTASSSPPQPTEPIRPTGTLRTEPVTPSAPSRPTPVTVSPSAVSPGAARPAASAPPAPMPPIAAPPARPAPPPSAPAAPPAAQPPQPLGTVTTAPTPPPSLSAAPPPPLTPSASTPPPATSQPNFYVVTDYTGNQSLESARRVVGNAYVRDFQGGTKIQMGAFSQESSARTLVEQLQQQGIPAQVYNTP